MIKSHLLYRLSYERISLFIINPGSRSKQEWHPQWDSNPCCRDENPVS